MKRLDPEQTFIAKIDRISGTGNGIIQLEDTHINIGPVTEGSVGKKIKATMVEEELAYCHTDTVKREGYKEKFPLMAEYDNNSTDNDSGLVGKTAVVRPTRTDSGITDQPAVNIRGKEILIRRAKVGRKTKIKIRIEGKIRQLQSFLMLLPENQ